MEIVQERKENALKIILAGSLDTTTAPALDGITALDFDLRELAYISSAVLRILLTTQKKMNKQGAPFRTQMPISKRFLTSPVFRTF